MAPQVKARELPAEKDVANQPPRIGVFVCNCGINIASVVDVKEVAEYAATLPNVVYIGDNLFTCSQDTQEKIRKVIEENELNRVVVAACSPRTHEPLFQDTIRSIGLKNISLKWLTFGTRTPGSTTGTGRGHGKGQRSGANGGGPGFSVETAH